MKRECCVCHKYLGEKEGPKDAVSHGFCDPCLKIYKAKMMADLEEFDKSEMVKNRLHPHTTENIGAVELEL
jgi:hypothetical protein